jgi:hypothetical protein
VEGARFVEFDFLAGTRFGDQRAGQGTSDPVAKTQRMMVSDIPKPMRSKYACVFLLPPATRPLGEMPANGLHRSGRGSRTWGRSCGLTVLQRHDRTELDHRCLAVASSEYPVWRRALLIERTVATAKRMSLMSFRMTQARTKGLQWIVTGTK